jgi:apurinic endonuclease APN1
MKLTKKHISRSRNNNKSNNLSKKSKKSKKNKKSYNKDKSIKNLSIGCHASITPSVLDSIKYVEDIGGNAVQIFLGSNRSASMKAKTKLNINEIKEIKEYCKTNNMVLIIHSIYLLNFCKYSEFSGRIQYAHQNLQHDLHLGQKLGARCVVLHLGFKNDLTMEEALDNLVGNIQKIVISMPRGIYLALETSAGQGTQFGYTLDALALLWSRIKHLKKGGKKAIGFTLDTAHIFVSGYDISTVNGIKDYLKQFDNLIGLENIINFHINDSRFALGSRHDEHRGIGSGVIYNNDEGKAALKYIKKFCMARKLPMILETHGAGSAIEEGSHKGAHGYEYEIALIKKL